MFESKSQAVADHVTKYWLTVAGEPLCYSVVLGLWESSESFRCDFTNLLAGSEYAAYRWETPPVTSATLGRPFEFVLLDTPTFADRSVDVLTYAQYFSNRDDHGVVAFQNLGGDATLIAPAPRAAEHCYGHLAAFLRSAPALQLHGFWQVIAETMKSQVGQSPIWLSTAGGGVAYLHARIDSRPKYYGYRPYTVA